MKLTSRVRQFSLLLPLPLIFSLTTVSYAASGIDESLVTPEAIDQLEQRAQQANPREQCFLYTELVHSMTELAGKEMLAGDTDQANATLKRVDHYAHLIHVSLAANAKRLKNAEMLMHHTIHRLADYHARRLRRGPGRTPVHPQATRPGPRRDPHPGLRPRNLI